MTLRTRKGESPHFQGHEGGLGLHTDVYKADRAQDIVVHCTGAAHDHCHCKWLLECQKKCHFQHTWECRKDPNRNIISHQPISFLANHRAEADTVRMGDCRPMNWTAHLSACMKSRRTQMISYVFYILKKNSHRNLLIEKVPLYLCACLQATLFLFKFAWLPTKMGIHQTSNNQIILL